MMMKRKFYFVVLVAVALSSLGSFTLKAQEYDVDKTKALFLPNIQHAEKRKAEFIEGKISEVPSEPYYKQIKFLNQPPPKTLPERVDRLTHGIKIDIPPEFDHYGYEIRRHMKSILTPIDLNNSMVLPDKLKNARTARIIMDYWKKALYEEMQAIEKEMDATQTNSTLKTTYRYNAGIVNVFIPDMYAWIDKNVEFLEMLQDNGGNYYVSYPFYDVPDSVLKSKLSTLYWEREAALENITKYSPFRSLIY